MGEHSERRSTPSYVRSLRPQVTTMLAEGFFRGLSLAGKLHPQARPAVHNVEVIPDLPYSRSGLREHMLDVYRPLSPDGAKPAILYIHGGGFHTLSKDTHWVMALLFARAGYTVFNLSYRLAPRHPFPAPLEDASDALSWLAEWGPRYGADLSRLVIAGESAGANLAASLALSTCYKRREPYAQRAFATGLVPRAVVAGCGILQVSDPGRFARRRKLPGYLARMIHDVGMGYLRGSEHDCELADPLLLLERGLAPERPLPAFFAFAGTKDPLLDDTRRLARALSSLGVPHEAHYYPGELHAFHALVFRAAAKRCWSDQLAFLSRHLGHATHTHVATQAG